MSFLFLVFLCFANVQRSQSLNQNLGQNLGQNLTSEFLLIPMLNIFNTQYLLQIGLGGGQKFVAVADTGSFDFWIPGIECLEDTDACPPDLKPEKLGLKNLPFTRHLFDESKSPTCQTINNDVRRITYGDGTQVKAVGIREHATLYDRDNRNLAVNTNAFKVVDFRSPRKAMLADGVVGLSVTPRQSQSAYGHKPSFREGFLSAVSATRKPALIESLFDQHPELPPQISVFLDFHRSWPKSPAQHSGEAVDLWRARVWASQASALILGKVTEEMRGQYARGKSWPVQPPRRLHLTSSGERSWVTSVVAIGLSGTDFRLDMRTVADFGAQPFTGTEALLDTGSSFIILRPDLWDSVVSVLAPKDGRGPCRVVSDPAFGRLISCPCNQNVFGNRRAPSR